MDILVGKRNQGKTTHLIEMSAAGKGIIVTPSERSVKYIINRAKEMKLDIPEPISWGRLVLPGYHRGYRGPFLLDELGGILRGA